MKHFLITLAALVFFGGHANAIQGWSLQTNPLGPQGDPTPALGKVQFVSATEGWISSDDGSLLHTTNGGTQWTVVTPGGTDTVGFNDSNSNGVDFINSTTGWAIGTLGGFGNPHGAVLYNTTNSGGNWSRKLISSWTFGFGVQFVDANNGWATVFNGPFPSNVSAAIVHTTNGGTTWSTQYTANQKVVFFTSFIDANNGWAFSDSLSASGKKIPPCDILNTTNAGATWSIQLHDTTLGAFEYIQMVDGANGWAVGDSAKILQTTNGGSDWISVTNAGINSSAQNKAVFFLDHNNGWIGSSVGGSGNYVLHTTNGGTSWETQSVPVQYSVFSLYFIDANNGWLSADYGGIAHTTNGGVLPVELVSFSVISSKMKTEIQWATATEVNNAGFDIERQPASVQQWTTIASVAGAGTSNSRHYYSYSDNIGKAGTYSYRLKQIDRDGTFKYSQEVHVTIEFPRVLALSQNYPEPFNPSTTIQFTVPNDGKATLKVYNSIGQEVATLFNDEATAGVVHLVQFNGSNLASGIYFSRLEFGGKMQVKKMLLLK